MTSPIPQNLLTQLSRNTRHANLLDRSNPVSKDRTNPLRCKPCKKWTLTREPGLPVIPFPVPLRQLRCYVKKIPCSFTQESLRQTL
jgi:hypothetical protein